MLLRLPTGNPTRCERFLPIMSLPMMLALMAGLSIPMGAMISANTWLRNLCIENEIDSFMAAFGGGALLAAIALVLVPHGIRDATLFTAPLSFLCGGVMAWGLSALIKRTGSSASQLLAMQLDFIPESIVLGASAAAGSGSGAAFLLASLIALQNMPEGFAAWHEMRSSGLPRSRLIAVFASAPLVGPVAAWLGFSFLSSSPHPLALLMLFCSGAILFLIFEDIAPSVKLKHTQFPAVGAVFGFMLGMIGAMIIGP